MLLSVEESAEAQRSFSASLTSPAHSVTPPPTHPTPLAEPALRYPAAIGDHTRERGVPEPARLCVREFLQNAFSSAWRYWRLGVLHCGVAACDEGWGGTGGYLFEVLQTE